jgi:hypothetical protein
MGTAFSSGYPSTPLPISFFTTISLDFYSSYVATFPRPPFFYKLPLNIHSELPAGMLVLNWRIGQLSLPAQT